MLNAAITTTAPKPIPWKNFFQPGSTPDSRRFMPFFLPKAKYDTVITRMAKRPLIAAHDAMKKTAP